MRLECHCPTFWQCEPWVSVGLSMHAGEI
jgi:hypothetical protein